VRDRSGAGDQDVGSALVGDRATADTLVDNHVSVGALVEDEAAAGGLVAFVAGRDPRALWSTAWVAWRCLRRPSMSRAARPADASAGLSARSFMPAVAVPVEGLRPVSQGHTVARRPCAHIVASAARRRHRHPTARTRCTTSTRAGAWWPRQA